MRIDENAGKPAAVMAPFARTPKNPSPAVGEGLALQAEVDIREPRKLPEVPAARGGGGPRGVRRREARDVRDAGDRRKLGPDSRHEPDRSAAESDESGVLPRRSIGEARVPGRRRRCVLVRPRVPPGEHEGRTAEALEVLVSFDLPDGPKKAEPGCMPNVAVEAAEYGGAAGSLRPVASRCDDRGTVGIYRVRRSGIVADE